jgi:hypothetical protein
LGLPELAEAVSASRRAQQLTVLPMARLSLLCVCVSYRVASRAMSCVGHALLPRFCSSHGSHVKESTLAPVEHWQQCRGHHRGC